MNAGRELDALVAEKVMGWREVYRDGDSGAYGSETGLGKKNVPLFSTDIAAAWDVVAEIRKDHAFTIHAESLSGGYLVHIDHNLKVIADTAPLAICLAALKATGAAPKNK